VETDALSGYARKGRCRGTLRLVAPGAARLKFRSDAGFHGELKRRVYEYFRRTGLWPRDILPMYFKTAAILVWFFASYAALVFAATTW
jgi:hypothetical protein